ncbi:EthD domain-containing protein [Sphingopyxis sp. MG]|uniref:EthD domain-containing protein n=1 Tax=Sphingopyxis sp. MG TaxID=1866325 RepID=UPI00227876E9|nr:EthD domain-containing protein [Sphingopyxis sp. MG]
MFVRQCLLSPSDRLAGCRYLQSHALADEKLARALSGRGCALPPYDGIAELWYDNADAVLAVGANEEARAARRLLLADEERFVDLPNSSIFWVHEHGIIGPSDNW